MSPTNAPKVSIYDTTLRDGNQARGISLSLADKLQLTRLFDEFGVDYVEGGWPNPTSTLDQEYFRAVASLPLKHAKIAAFGSTRRPGNSCSDDPTLRSLLDCGARVLTIFGKSWDLHATEVLRTTLDENLRMMRQKYDNQLCTMTDLLDAQSQWQQARSNLIEAQTQQKIYETEYLRVTGTLE